MIAARVHRFGPPSVIVVEEMEISRAAADEVVVKVAAAGVGPWDGWIRSGRSVLPQPQPLPLTLGSDIAGTVDTVGSDVVGFKPGDEAYGVTNARFTGGDDARVSAGQRVLILGAGSNVGSMAVQLAHLRCAHVLAERRTRLETLAGIDVVIDASGGEKQLRCLHAMKRGGVLVSSVSAPDAELLARHGVTGEFILVNAATRYLEEIARLVDAGSLKSLVGTILPLARARLAHEMLEGGRPHAPGKIVLKVTDVASGGAA